MNVEKAARRTEKLVAQISPILFGHGPEVQSAALADLTAMWIAGNLAFDNQGNLDQKQTAILRSDLLRAWLETVHKLIPENEETVLKLLEREAMKLRLRDGPMWSSISAKRRRPK